ncbi:hypothetical protein RN001_001330 [Aquatica leii]|uniref:SAGA-associated factor 11 n=1 Tax=Aquatica leii TaxID=1421715 RepID=A0AAN7SL59_9COLE|nr:hypothetical protein RN001_001330 [Aquatica leii]
MSKNQNANTNVDKEFQEIVSNKELLRQASEKYLERLIDNITIGVVFEVHRNKKAKVVELDKEIIDKQDGPRPCVDIFGPYNFKKKYECLCRNCDRIVGASVFAPHLEVCMGMGRSRSRNASRRIANSSRERENSSYTGIASDDEDDMDWSSGDKRKKKKDRNGNKKLKGNSKKANDMNDSVESINIDVEGETDDILSLRDLMQDFTRGPSPADSVSSSGSTKRRDKSKNKKRKERVSPNSIL